MAPFTPPIANKSFVSSGCAVSFNGVASPLSTGALTLSSSLPSTHPRTISTIPHEPTSQVTITITQTLEEKLSTEGPIFPFITVPPPRSVRGGAHASHAPDTGSTTAGAGALPLLTTAPSVARPSHNTACATRTPPPASTAALAAPGARMRIVGTVLGALGFLALLVGLCVWNALQRRRARYLRPETFVHVPQSTGGGTGTGWGFGTSEGSAVDGGGKVRCGRARQDSEATLVELVLCAVPNGPGHKADAGARVGTVLRVDLQPATIPLEEVGRELRALKQRLQSVEGAVRNSADDSYVSAEAHDLPPAYKVSVCEGGKA